jgi:nitrogen regulatory protein PII
VIKLVTAIIQPYRLDDVQEALDAVGITGMTVTEVRGYGQTKGHIEHMRGESYMVNFVAKTEIKILTTEDKVQQIVETIIETARTGRLGDGKIFITSVEDVIRIRTGEHDAI